MDNFKNFYRKARRKAVDFPAELTSVEPGGAVLCEGTARIADLSPDGALLVDVRLDGDQYPHQTFQIELRITEGPYRGIGFLCDPVRFDPASKGVGVRVLETYVQGQA